MADVQGVPGQAEEDKNDLMNRFSPFVDKSLAKFGRDQIWNIKSLIDSEITSFKDNCKYFPDGYEAIINNKAEWDADFVDDMLKKITSDEDNKKGTLKFRTIVKYIAVSKQLEKKNPTINPTKYPLIIEVAKILNKLEKFRINGFADLVISKLLTLSKDKSVPFEDICKAYHFAFKLSTVIENRYLMNTELSYLMASIKCRIYDKTSNPTEESVQQAISYICLAESHSADLQVFKESLILSIKQWCSIGKLPENFDYTSLLSESQKLDFEEPKDDQETIYEVEEEKEAPPELVIDYGQLIETKKMNVLYMTNQHLVNVAIWKAQIVETGKIIAIKECISPDLEGLKGYVEEANVLRVLSGTSNNFLHFHAAKLEQMTEGDNNRFVYTIQMEFVENTLKNDKLQRDAKNRPYNDLEILSIYKQLILAYNLMREKNILHCDIKPSNIMITNDFVIKIIDFNAAKIGIDERTQQIGALGTKDFMSPEIRLGFDSNTPAALKEDKSDVFSLGLTILSLVTKGQLVDLNLEKNRQQLIDIIESIRYEWLKPILHGMLEFDYSKRSGLKDLIKAFPEDTTVTQQV